MYVKRLKIISCCLAIASAAMAQTAFVTQDSVAVFYPKDYDASQHEPSPIFEREPAATCPLPANWRVRPVFSEKDGKSIATIHVGNDVDLYGTGEVTGPLRRNGKSIKLWNIDTPAYGTDGGTHLYQSHPWVMGLRQDGSAFGIIADNTWRQNITTDEDVVFESQGPAFRVIVIERCCPRALMQALADLTGHMEMPPLWSLGYQQCRFSYQPDTRVMEVADLLRKHRIPADVIWMDIDYMDGYKIFTFSPKEFPNPTRLNDYLHQKNFKAVYMIDPGVKVEKGYFVDDQGTAADYWVKDKDGKPFVGNVWPGPCHFPDFTRPEVRTWWATLYKDYMATGIDGVWNDMNEPSVFGGPETSMPADNWHEGGDGVSAGPHLRFHNVFGLNMVRASRMGLLLANPDKRPFILSRSNFLGGHRYAATWTGDNLSSPEQMKLSVPMTLTLGLSGQPFNGPDIGGFCESATPELLAQWTALGVYFPFVRNHSIKGSVDQEPWAFTPEVLNTCRTAIERRYLLMPYVYTAFREAHLTGMPVMRPMFMADAKDLSLRSEDQAFLLGGDLMVVPCWAENTAMPKDEWQVVDLSTLNTPHEPYKTHKTHKTHETQDPYQSTLRQRPGSIIPLANLAQSTTEMSTDSLTLLVCLDKDGKACGQIYEDEGDGFSYKKGNYLLSQFEATLQKRQLTVTMTPADDKHQTSNFKLQTSNFKLQTPRTLRIAYVKNGKLQFSAWQSGTMATMKVK